MERKKFKSFNIILIILLFASVLLTGLFSNQIANMLGSEANISTAVIIMILAGVFGGYTSFLITINTHLTLIEYTKTPIRFMRRTAICGGLAASVMTPLFLTIINRLELLEKINENSNSLVFAGYCMMASLFFPTFLNRIAISVLKSKVEENKNAFNDDLPR